MIRWQAKISRTCEEKCPKRDGEPRLAVDDSAAGQLELHRQVHEHKAAEGIVDLREGIAVAEDRWARDIVGHDGRILVEYVVDPGAQRERLVDAPRRGEVKVVSCAQGAVDRGHSRTEQRIGARAFVQDLIDMAPGEGEIEVPGRIPAHASLVAPFRVRRAALPTVETDAVE